MTAGRMFTALFLAVVCIASFSACGDYSQSKIILEWSQKNYTLTIGATIELSYTAEENGVAVPESELQFSSDDERIVRIEDGKINAVSEGETKIVIRYRDSVSNATVTVTHPSVIEEELVFPQKVYALAVGIEGVNSATVSCTLKRNGEAVENAEISYRLQNEGIAEIDENGKLIAKAVGKTVMTATCGSVSATADVTVYATATEEQINSYSEEYVNLFGRNDLSMGALVLDNVASGMEFVFYGTEVKAEIQSTAALYCRVYLDGDQSGKRLSVAKGKADYSLATGLEKGIHTVRLLKSSEIYDGQIKLIGISGAEQYLRAEKRLLSLEFIGDSITCGYGVLGTGSRTVENSDACCSFATLTAMNLDADFSCIALQGICVKALMWQQVSMNDMYRVTSLKTYNPFSFGDSPDAVILGLGTNDAAYLERHPEYAKQFSSDYADFLRYVRQKRPNAYIVCVYGMMGRNVQIDAGIMQAIENLNDEKISYLSTFEKNNVGADGHPSFVAQKEYSEILSEYLTSLLWTTEA